MTFRRNRLSVLPLVLLAFGSAARAELVQFRSGQTGGIPGTPGSLDDIVRINPWGNPGGAPVLGTAFTAADFAATSTGPAAMVVQPVSPWMGGVTAPLSDPLARWINWTADSSGYGTAGSVLYAVPFWINTVGITNAVLTFEGGADDMLGDWFYGGPNPDGLYINGVAAGYQYVGFNFGSPTTHTQNITGMVNTGQNYLYYYQRDAGFGVSGIIFSGKIHVTPTPGALSALGLAGLVATRRRRH
ncbi:MAG: hypothetical protein IPJ41_06790 [Phycisphaerales bacterium]|nr:hypothetical protein [Phycisphaerales bacterium]